MKIKSNTLYGCVIFFSMFIFILILNSFYNMDYIALFIYFVFLLFIYKINSQMYLKYLLMFVMFSYHIISVFIVENTKIYFFNLQTLSSHTGCFIPILFSYVLYYMVLLLMEANTNSRLLLAENGQYLKKIVKLKFGRLKLSENKIAKIITFVLFLAIFFMLFRMRNTFFYKMGGIDRFEFRASFFTELDEKFYTYITWLLPIPLLIKDYKNRKIPYVFFALYCLYMIWVGDKFGSLFIAFYIFVLTTWVTKDLDKKVIRKIIIFAGLILIVLMLFIAFQVLYERGSFKEVIIYFNNRLTGGQSDLWWKIFSSDQHNGWRITEFFRDEVSAIFKIPNNVLDYNFGIYKMMKLTAPGWVVDNYLSSGIRFAASTQATLFYYFKFTGLYLGSIILGFLCFFLVNKALRAYRNVDIIRAVCYTMLVTKWYLMMSMSDITVLGNTTTILAIIILCFMHILDKKYLKKLRSRQNEE